MMNIIVDADSCNKLSTIVSIAKKYDIEVHIFYDTSHYFDLDSEDYISHIVDKGRDSADFSIANFCKKGDIVITKDGGLAAMVLGREGYCIHTNGMEYNDKNISAILANRYMNKKARDNVNKYKIFKIKHNNTGSSNYGHNLSSTLSNIINKAISRNTINKKEE